MMVLAQDRHKVAGLQKRGFAIVRIYDSSHGQIEHTIGKAAFFTQFCGNLDTTDCDLLLKVDFFKVLSAMGEITALQSVQIVVSSLQFFGKIMARMCPGLLDEQRGTNECCKKLDHFGKGDAALRKSMGRYFH